MKLRKSTAALLFGIATLTTQVSAITIFTEDFSTAGTPTDSSRIDNGNLDGGWYRTTGYGAENTPSAWTISGGQLNNPTNTAPTGTAYTASESPAYNWFSNTSVGANSDNSVTVSFDYSVGVGDSLHLHLWAVQSGGVAGPPGFISNNEAWQNGNSLQNQTSSNNGSTPYNLLDGSNAPSTSSLSGALTGSGTFSQTIDISALGISGVSDVADINSFLIAFGANETGGGTLTIDNVSLVSVPEPSSSLLLSAGLLGLLLRRKR